MKLDKAVHWQQRSDLYICIIGFLATSFLIFPQWLPILWSNLGYVQRNKALWEVKPQSSNAYSNELAQAVRLFEHSGQFDPCNPLGFLPKVIVACAEVSKWPKASIHPANNEYNREFLVAQRLEGIRYGQVLSLNLSNGNFKNINSFTILTAMGNSTRIHQGELVAYATLITSEGSVYLLPLHAGIETAEWAYEFPDVPPQHSKPVASYPLPHGGDGYPLRFNFERAVTPKIITLLFVYTQRWHVQPSLTIWAVGV